MQYVLQAFQTVLQPYNIIVIILATGSGLLMGMLPGLSATMAIALLTADAVCTDCPDRCVCRSNFRRLPERNSH